MFLVFSEISKHTVSPLRAFQHVLDSWACFAAGLVVQFPMIVNGGFATLRRSFTGSQSDQQDRNRCRKPVGGLLTAYA